MFVVYDSHFTFFFVLDCCCCLMATLLNSILRKFFLNDKGIIQCIVAYFETNWQRPYEILLIGTFMNTNNNTAWPDDKPKLLFHAFDPNRTEDNMIPIYIDCQLRQSDTNIAQFCSTVISSSMMQSKRQAIHVKNGYRTFVPQGEHAQLQFDFEFDFERIYNYCVINAISVLPTVNITRQYHEDNDAQMITATACRFCPYGAWTYWFSFHENYALLLASNKGMFFPQQIYHQKNLSEAVVYNWQFALLGTTLFFPSSCTTHILSIEIDTLVGAPFTTVQKRLALPKTTRRSFFTMLNGGMYVGASDDLVSWTLYRVEKVGEDFHFQGVAYLPWAISAFGVRTLA